MVAKETNVYPNCQEDISFSDTINLTIHMVDKIVAIAIFKEINETF